jgi:hypothetical protein
LIDEIEEMDEESVSSNSEQGNFTKAVNLKKSSNKIVARENGPMDEKTPKFQSMKKSSKKI